MPHPATTLAVGLLIGGALLGGVARAAERPAVPVDDTLRNAILATVIAEVNAYYVDPETAGRIEQRLRARIAEQDYADLDELTPFLDRVRADLREVSADRHLGVWPIWFAPRPLDDSDDARREWEQSLRRENYGFQAVEHLAGNVGYLDLRSFADAGLGGDTAVAAMGLLAGSDALIIDLRRNHGGSSDMVDLLCSYFFDEPVQTLTVHTRYKDETVQSWTPAHVSGKRLADTPLYLLLGGDTASAAEHFAYALRVLGRATLVGETSRGAANTVEEKVFPELSLSLALPVGRATHPLTGTGWEGVGVEPHVAVRAEQALREAHLLALKRLLEDAPDSPRREELADAIRQLQ